MRNLKLMLYCFVAIATISCSDDDSSEEYSIVKGEVTDIDGNVYETVVIGDQTWMAENLKVTTYPDGSLIPLIDDDDEWALLGENNSDKGYCIINNDANGELDIYGALYTYAAATNGIPHSGITVTQGACPDGWHIPTIDEWKELQDNVGGINKAGANLKMVSNLWGDDAKISKNQYGFSALPGGNRYLYNGDYIDVGQSGSWWTSSENTLMDAYVVSISASSSGLHYYLHGKSYGKSVRCIKD